MIDDNDDDYVDDAYLMFFTVFETGCIFGHCWKEKKYIYVYMPSVFVAETSSSVHHKKIVASTFMLM